MRNFNALANEYESNLSELELDLRHANVDNARLEAEYIKFDDFLSFFIKKIIFPLDSKKHGQNLLMNGLNQQMKKCLPKLNYLIYEHGKFINICIKKKRRIIFFINRLSDAEFRLSLERYKPRSTVVDEYEREIRRLRDDIEFAQRRSRARSLSPV